MNRYPLCRDRLWRGCALSMAALLVSTIGQAEASAEPLISPGTQAAPPAARTKAHDRAQILASPPPSSRLRVQRNAAEPALAPRLKEAYTAFQQGDDAQAEHHYRQHLQQDPRSRDALLGLAALALRQTRLEVARALYQQLLRLDPLDPIARAALLSLNPQAQAEASERQLRQLHDSHPQADTAAALGSLLARQGRWREAQHYYFQAHHAEPQQADHAFNLAVSLDALGEGRMAAGFYRQALNLAQQARASFDVLAATQRLSELERP
ncbi:tetratricopeptide repeat protein [Chitinimonas taiwanensis]|uniref:Tetratricopeptide repeat-containing protein n=1 Tax=Chitinimonas taiwanensis DSM 18899 TaxID=1121279 RepID=A0A1K2HK12_9NEIS|nr:tetratricopeptide repeat protein [Chitinimonas taiwanensis]SFZ77160.1 Tetratricopeptide repeat-containing protein [Chitinimonas taiwanensis DSM 18899]